MFKKISIIIISFLAVLFASCSKDSANLKTIQKQSVGDYIVLITSSSGNIQKGTGIFYIEFHTVNGGHLTDAGKVDANAIMHMSGMPMSTDIAVTPTDKTGRYEAKYDFSMSGTWILEINFNSGMKAQFSLVVN